MLIFGFMFAQYPYEFSQMARNAEMGSAQDVQVGPDGTVFAGYSFGGLKAYIFDGNSFQLTAEEVSASVYAMALDSKGTIFTSGSNLAAYDFNDEEFHLLATEEIGSLRDVAVMNDSIVFTCSRSTLYAFKFEENSFSLIISEVLDPYYYHQDGRSIYLSDSNMVFWSCGEDGLLAYHFDGESFTLKGEVNEGEKAYSVTQNDDGLLFLADFYGIRVYDFDGSDFNLVAYRNDGSFAHEIAIGYDGKAYLACGGYFYVYTLVDSSLELEASVLDWGLMTDVCINSDGTLFLADSHKGIAAYTLNDTGLCKIAIANGGGRAKKIAESPNGTIFLANGYGGLWAYDYDGNSFNKLAHQFEDVSGYEGRSFAAGVFALNDSTVFLANGEDGIRVYRFKDSVFTQIAHINQGGYARDITVTKDSTVYLADEDHGLRAYRFTGDSLLPIARFYSNRGDAYEVEVSDDGIIYLAYGYYGLYALALEDSSFCELAHIDNGEVKGICLYHNSTVYQATGTNGIAVNTYSDSAFTETVNYPIMARSYDIYVENDSTIFVAAIMNMLCCELKDSTGEIMAEYREGGEAYDVMLNKDGAVMLANNHYGLQSFFYSGYVSVQHEDDVIVQDFKLKQNYPNPFNPVTTIGYDVYEESNVRLDIYNISGQHVETLVDEFHLAGAYKVKWDASKYSSGIYIYRLEYLDKHISRKMLLIK